MIMFGYPSQIDFLSVFLKKYFLEFGFLRSNRFFGLFPKKNYLDIAPSSAPTPDLYIQIFPRSHARIFCVSRTFCTKRPKRNSLRNSKQPTSKRTVCWSRSMAIFWNGRGIWLWKISPIPMRFIIMLNIPSWLLWWGSQSLKENI